MHHLEIYELLRAKLDMREFAKATGVMKSNAKAD